MLLSQLAPNNTQTNIIFYYFQLFYTKAVIFKARICAAYVKLFIDLQLPHQTESGRW